MIDRNTHRLWELLLGALSLCGGTSGQRWERHLVDEFGAFLGGEDIFPSRPALLPDGGYVLVTTVGKNEVCFNVYEHVDSVSVALPDARRYEIAGRGLFVKCMLGDSVQVRHELERSYNNVIKLLGEDKFRESIGKNVPYVVDKDKELFDISVGVVDYKTGLGVAEAPLVLVISGDARLAAGQYREVRRYADLETLVKGLFGAWIALLSADDWDQFSELTYSIFQ